MIPGHPGVYSFQMNEKGASWVSFKSAKYLLCYVEMKMMPAILNYLCLHRMILPQMIATVVTKSPLGHFQKLWINIILLGPVYIIPFSYENGMEMLSYENGIV